jgi:hypothetical protein
LQAGRIIRELLIELANRIFIVHAQRLTQGVRHLASKTNTL